jgi:very-short-patch-repair endonuclease
MGFRSLQFTEKQYAEHQARVARLKAKGSVRTILGGKNERPPKAKAPKVKPAPWPKIDGSQLERQMMLQIIAERLPAPMREHYPFRDRKFRLDFSWPDLLIALEVDGAVHRIKARFHADIERHNLLLLAGWRVLRAGREEIKDGRALGWLKQLLGSA